MSIVVLEGDGWMGMHSIEQLLTDLPPTPVHPLHSTAEEFRKLKRRKAQKVKAEADGEEDEDEDGTAPFPSAEQKRTLGLIILRGETVVSLSVEGPPPAEKQPGAGATVPPGVGRGLPAGRGIGIPAPPGPPGMTARPMAYGRPPIPMGMPPMGGTPPGFPSGPPPGFPSGPPPAFPMGAPPGFRPPGYGMPPPRQ